MQISDTRNKTPNHYSIQDVKVRFEIRGSIQDPAKKKRTECMQPHLVVALKAEPYSRNRFEGSTYETKKHGAKALVIDCEELEIMVGALRKELAYCYSVFLKNSLFGKLDEFKKEWPNLY